MLFIFFQQKSKIIKDTLKNLQEDLKEDNVHVIVLTPEIEGGSIGLTLAGGIDYETKDVIVSSNSLNLYII